MAKAKSAIPEGHHTVTPVLTLDNAAQAIRWYEKAFGANEISRAAAPDGKILHAEIQIGDSRIMLQDEIPNGKSPKSLGGSPASLWLYVKDSDALFERALKAGAHVFGGTMGKMTDQFWGDRSGTVVDPFGFSWSISTRKEDLTREEIEHRQAAWMKNFAPQPTPS
jgi:PhnB protein